MPARAHSQALRRFVTRAAGTRHGVLLHGLDVFCLASRREALSLALLEALAHGLPSVTTDVGATAEAVGDAALVVPPEDPAALVEALDAVLADSGLRRRLGAAAFARARREFGAARMVDQMAAVLAGAARTAWASVS